MKQFPAFLILMKTNFGKFIAEFVDTKFESTEGMEFEEGGKRWAGKQSNVNIVFYFLWFKQWNFNNIDKIVGCFFGIGCK